MSTSIGTAPQLDERGFHRAADEYRAELHAHCYRMLGSFHDAEDAFQDTLLRAWRAFPRFDGRSSLRTWLHAIATNVCLDAIARRPKRLLPVDYGPPTAAGADFGTPLVETVWIEPYPDDELALGDDDLAPDARYEQREAVELAFVAALQHLPGTQRAVLILREVLGFSAKEVSETLDTSVASVNSSLQRARASLGRKLPERSQQETLRLLGDRRVAELVDAYVDAWMRKDVEALQSLLAADAVFSMPPWSSWWRGRDEIIALMESTAGSCPESRAVLTHANGQPAIAYYALDDERGRYVGTAIDVLTYDGDQVRDVTAFITPTMFPAFGLDAELDG